MRLRPGGLLLVLAGILAAQPEPWRFGIVADTQWPDLGDSTNPNLVGAGFIRQIDSIFIARNVEFVVALGDQADYGYPLSEDTRASAAQELYDRGIGFFPLRGNHEAFDFSAGEFLKVYPQTRDGRMNRTPVACRIRIPGFRPPDSVPPTDTFRIGTDFSCPGGAGCGLSYSFRHRDATFVLLDQYTAADGSPIPVSSQLDWISDVLTRRPAGTHAFVMAHEGLIMPDHPDGLLGTDPSQDSASTGRFVSLLAATGTRWFLNGHDHIHSRSLVEAPWDSSARVQDITCASAAYKFHFARTPSNDEVYDIPAFGRARERILAQESAKVGLYVVTVDGDDVEAEHIAADPGSGGADLDRSPDLTGRWTLRETFGYTLGGRDFVEPRGTSLAGRELASPGGLRARILRGGTGDRVDAPDGRPYWRRLSLGWSTDGSGREVFRLGGLALRIGNPSSAPFALAVAWPDGAAGADDPLSGTFGLARADGKGGWTNAVATNSDGVARFHARGLSDSDGLGDWGIDTLAREAWAVVDRDGRFAVVGGLEELPAPSRPVGREALSFRQVGVRLVMPPSFDGERYRIDFRSFDGSWIDRRDGVGPQVPLPEGFRRPAVAELRVGDGPRFRGFVFLP